MSQLSDRLKIEHILQQLNDNIKILGIDLGKRKIGYAIFHSNFDSVLPGNIVVKNGSDLEVISKIASENGCSSVVIGAGSNRSISQGVVKLQKEIEAKLAIPVFLQDEQFTTYLANEILRDIGVSTSKKRDRVDDAIAAKIILERFISSIKYL